METSSTNDTDAVSWTPLRQECGCVTDWGWASRAVPPPVFIQWCMEAVSSPCPWHLQHLPDDGQSVTAQVPGTGHVIHARRAVGADTALGAQLFRRLRDLMASVVAQDRTELAEQIPARYRDWMIAKGHDPVDTWLDQQLSDIVLNRGHELLTRGPRSTRGKSGGYAWIGF